MNQVTSGAMALLQYGVTTVLLPAMQTITSRYADAADWIEAQARTHLNARIAAVVRNMFILLAPALFLFILPPELYMGQ